MMPFCRSISELRMRSESSLKLKGDMEAEGEKGGRREPSLPGVPGAPPTLGLRPPDQAILTVAHSPAVTAVEIVKQLRMKYYVVAGNKNNIDLL